MEEKITELLTNEFPEIDFTASDALVDDGILDSLTITGIIATLSMEFGITIPYWTNSLKSCIKNLVS